MLSILSLTKQYGITLTEDYWSKHTKGGFFSESAMRFLDLQISKKKIFRKAILSLKFKFPAKNSKQQIQISSSG